MLYEYACRAACIIVVQEVHYYHFPLQEYRDLTDKLADLQTRHHNLCDLLEDVDQDQIQQRTGFGQLLAILTVINV